MEADDRGGHVIPRDDLEAWTTFFRERAEAKAAREGQKAKY